VGRLGDGRLRIGGDRRRALQADVAVAPVGELVGGAQDVSRALDVFDRQRPVDLFGALALFGKAPRGRFVFGAVTHRLLEDGRVGGDARDAIVPGQSTQLA